MLPGGKVDVVVKPYAFTTITITITNTNTNTNTTTTTTTTIMSGVKGGCGSATLCVHHQELVRGAHGLQVSSLASD
jgi:hypothetical protein